MADYQRTVRRTAGPQAAQIDQGLRAYMNKVYMLMSVGLAITGAVAFAVGNSPELLQVLFGTPLKWVVMLAPLGLVMFLGARLNTMSASAAQMTFWVFAALMGASISYIFAVYTGISIVKTFFVTAAAFLGLSLYGYTTKRSLSAMGSFLVMGVIGLVIASIVNLFLHSSALDFAISALGVLIFAGLTAYDTQKIKNQYIGAAGMGGQGEAYLQKGAIMGALTLYLDFINLFLFLLRFMGNRN